MNVLLAGGAGYIGSHAAIVLVNAGHRVVLYDNLHNSRPEAVERIRMVLSGQVCGASAPADYESGHDSMTFVQGDIRDVALLTQTLKKYRIDAVMHFAGSKAVAESVSDPLQYYQNNVCGTVSLLEAMQSAEIYTLVFSSSATVYGVPQYLPIDEIHPTRPINPYGRTKLQIEEILEDLCASNDKWRAISLRYFNPVGAHESGLIGEDPLATPSNLMPYLARVAIGVFPDLSIFGNDYSTADGTGVRDYIHVMDLAEGHLSALNYLQDRAGHHCVNLGTGRGYSVLELVRAFESASGRVVPFRIAPKRPGDVDAVFSSVKKATALLGWTASRDIGDMCESEWVFIERLEKLKYDSNFV